MLDPLLPRFDIACETSAQFDAFWRSVGQRFKRRHGAPVESDLTVPLVLPENLRRFLGEAQVVRDGDEWTFVEVSFAGKYRGLRVKSLSFLLGKENGWSTVALHFEEPEQRVRRTLDATVKRGAAALERLIDDGQPPSLSIAVQENVPHLVCDFSA